MDTNGVGPTVFQPFLFAGQYQDVETATYADATGTLHRPAIALNGHRTYDVFTGSYLQVDPLIDTTWSTYVYVNGDPVGQRDPDGLLGCGESAPAPPIQDPETGEWLPNEAIGVCGTGPEPEEDTESDLKPSIPGGSSSSSSPPSSNNLIPGAEDPYYEGIRKSLCTMWEDQGIETQSPGCEGTCAGLGYEYMSHCTDILQMRQKNASTACGSTIARTPDACQTAA